MIILPLRYRICKWSQASKCLSNNSRQFHICVDKFINNDKFTGEVIKVEHDTLGVLFAAVTGGTGLDITDYDDRREYIPWMTTAEILKQLRKFGFIIYYNEISSLDDKTLDELIRISNLGYDKITKIAVMTRKDGKLTYHTYPIAMKSADNTDLWGFGIKVDYQKFNERMAAGVLLSLEDIALDWSWLDFMYNIKDILDENKDFEGFDRMGDEPYLTDQDEFDPYSVSLDTQEFTIYE